MEDVEDEVDLQINRFLNMSNSGDESETPIDVGSEVVVTPSLAYVAALAFSGRKIPFPNALTEDGKRNGYQIL